MTTLSAKFSELVCSYALMYNIGAFGEVRLCTHRKTGAKRAVKIIKKSFLQGKEETRFLTEIEILKTMVS